MPETTDLARLPSQAVSAAYDVFVAYAEADREWVRGCLLAALAEAGVTCCTRDSFGLTRPALEALGLAVEASRRTLLVLSPASLADHGQEMVALLAQHLGSETATWPVLPLLIDGVRRERLPLRLRLLEPLDLGDPATRDDSLARLIADLGRSPGLPPEAPACPYVGMRAFSEADAAWYHGREDDIEAAVRHLRTHPWLFVVGSSGCGKSSLVRAGLVPRARAAGQDVVLVRPGAVPLEALAEALAATQAAVRAGHSVLLVVDQLEEVFARPAAVVDFWRALEAVVSRDVDARDSAPRPVVRCALTVRADFYPQLMGSPLWPVVRDRRLELVPMSGRSLARAVLAPAEAVGVYVASPLVERLVEDADGQPGALPFLQETLVLLWGRLEHRYLPVSAYDNLVLTRPRYGDTPRTGLQVAMADRADDVMAALPSDEARHLAQRTLVRLVQFGDGRADVRRQLPVVDLMDDRDDPELFEQVLAALVDAHLLTLTADGTAGAPAAGARSAARGGRRADLSHEALITGWPALGEWIEQRREAERLRRGLETSAVAWEELGGTQGGLLDEVELQQAERWLVHPVASDVGRSARVDALLRASRQAVDLARRHRRRTDRVLRALAAGLAVLLVLSLAGAGVAVHQRQQAVTARGAAVSDELALQAAQLPRERLDTALLLGRGALGLRTSARSRQGLLAALRANPRVLRVVSATPALDAVSTSPDGTLVAFGDDLGQVRVLDTVRYLDVAPVRRVAGEVRAVAFSPDGLTVAASSSSGEVQQWPVREAAPLGRALDGHTGAVRALAYSPDGAWLASGGVDGRVVLHALHPGVADRVLTGARDWVQALAFTRDGGRLVSGGGANESHPVDTRVLVWDVAAGRPVREIDGGTDAVRALALSPDGHTLAFAGADTDVHLVDLTADSPPRVLHGHTERVFGLAFLDGGAVLASAGRDHDIRLWDPATGLEAGAALRGHDAAVRGLAVAGGRLLSVGDDGRLVVWAATGPEPSRVARPLGSPARAVWAVAVAPDGLVATGDDEGVVELARPSSAGAPVRLQLPGPAYGLAFAGGGRLATTTYDGALELWDAATGALLAGPVDTGDRSAVVAASTDGSLLATGGTGGLVRVWTPGLAPVGRARAGHRSWVRGVAFRGSDGALFSVGADGLALRWRHPATSEAPQPVVLRTSAFSGVALSPDGRTLATADVEGDAVLWPAAGTGTDRRRQQVLPGSGSALTSVAYASGGRLLVTTDTAGTVRLWDVRDGYREVGELDRGAPAHAAGAAVAGTSVVVGTDAGVRAYDLDLGAWARTACAVAGRELSSQERASYYAGVRPPSPCPGASPPPPVPSGLPAPDS